MQVGDGRGRDECREADTEIALAEFSEGLDSDSQKEKDVRASFTSVHPPVT